MRRFSLPALILGLAFTSLTPARAWAGAEPDAVDVELGRPRIINHVIDLLDHEVSLVWGSEHHSWESRAFDAGQFTRIGLKATFIAEAGQVSCFTLWQFSRDDEFVESSPRISLGLFELPGLRLSGPVGFTEVSGVRAKIRCEASVAAAGTLTDVKVLLRRE